VLVSSSTDHRVCFASELLLKSSGELEVFGIYRVSLLFVIVDCCSRMRSCGRRHLRD